MIDDIAAHLRVMQLEGELHQHQMISMQMRKFLAGALCSVCGEPLGHDEEIIQDDDDQTMHAKCEMPPTGG